MCWFWQPAKKTMGRYCFRFDLMSNYFKIFCKYNNCLFQRKIARRFESGMFLCHFLKSSKSISTGVFPNMLSCELNEFWKQNYMYNPYFL